MLGVWVSAADVSDAQGAYQVLDEVLARYREAQVVIADSAYDREGLLEWLLSKWEVGLDCVARSGEGFGCSRVGGWWSVVLRGCWGVVGWVVVMTSYVRWRRVGL